MEDESPDYEAFMERFEGLRKSFPDNTVHYAIYIVQAGLADREIRSQLNQVQKAVNDIRRNLLKDYIWQREIFELKLKQENSVWCLSGSNCFGESIADEWVIVYALREVSVQFQNAWIRIYDNDGEFLLIEAADALPDWLTTDVNDRNRVWVHRGKIYIIKPGDEISEEITIEEALACISKNASALFNSADIDAEAFHNIREYPAAIWENFHHGLVILPRKVAYLLHRKPSFISIASEYFQPRDLELLRSLQSSETDNLNFPPVDFVSISVLFTRLTFSQLKSARFDAPISWRGRLPSSCSAQEVAKADMGMRICCGLEMFLQDPDNEDKQEFREIRLLLEDIRTGDEKLPTDDEIASWSKQNDDESWLNISMEQLDKLLSGNTEKTKTPEKPSSAKVPSGSTTFEENIRRRFEKFNQFKDDPSMDFEDDESEEGSGDEDEEIELDPAEFERIMRDALG